MIIKLIKKLILGEFYYFLFRRRKVTHIYCGTKLHIYLENIVSESWYDSDWKRYEIDFLKKKLNLRGLTVFNIGAHEGIVALIFSKIVTNAGKVVAVEMNSKHAKVAKINKLLNNANNLQIINAAISNKIGKITYSEDQVLKDSNFRRMSYVEATTIDDLTNKFGVPSLIYIDIEGFEYFALQGAEKTIKKLPSFCIEVHSNNGLETYNGSVQRIIKLFPKNEYKFYMGKAEHNSHIIKFSPNNELTKDRFYLIALPYTHKGSIDL